MRVFKTVLLTAAFLTTSVSALASAPLCPTPREVSEVKLLSANKYHGRVFAETSIAYIFHDGRFWFVKVGPLDEGPSQSSIDALQTHAKQNKPNYVQKGNALVPLVAQALGFRSTLDEHQWRCRYTIAGHQLVWAFAYSPVTNRDLNR